MAKFLIQTTSVQIAYFLYFLVRVRDRSFFIMQGAAGGIWGVGGMRKKKLAFRWGHPKNRGGGHGKYFSKTLE